MISYIFLDLDDTVLDYAKAEAYALSRLNDALRISDTAENHRIFAEISENIWRVYARGGARSEDLVKQLYQRYFEAVGCRQTDYEAADRMNRAFLSAAGFLLPGAVEFVKQCRSYAKIIAVSNGNEKVQASRLACSELAPYIDALYTSDRVGCAKADPRFFDYVFAQEGIRDRKSVIMFGDSEENDIRAAQNAGIRAIRYRSTEDYNAFLNELKQY